jgi:predicted N-acetyltransferase YhbS
MQTTHYSYLGEQPQHIETIARWHQAQWQHLSPQHSVESRINLYSSYNNSPDVPFCLLATQQGQAVGSASVVECDMDTRRTLSPWLASVYVHPSCRQQGIATELIRRCTDLAAQNNVERLYLFTPDQTDFYKKRGWQPLEHCLYHNERVDIMYYSLKP